MRHLFLSLVVLCVFAVPALANEYVQGYYRSDGTYVAPHYRSSPDGTATDNWSSKGNTNPYTGEIGTKDPYKSNNNGYGQDSGNGNYGSGTYGSQPKNKYNKGY